jgi:hydroxymethylpyrimidine pyrophosphatase-like HAD family hydrolase
MDFSLNYINLLKAQLHLECIKYCYGVCPANAHNSIRENANFVLETNGGMGVFLELEKQGDVNGLLYLLQIVDEIYLFRNGHWNFVQRYIMANTKFENATGGTPITSWLVNQIDAVLKYEEKIMLSIDELSSLEDENLNIYNKLKETLSNKKKLLLEQVEEMRNKEYDVDKIYEKNKEYLLEDKVL